MLLTKTVDLKCLKGNKEHLESIGYKWKKNLIINDFPLSNLPPTSRVKVTYKCDFCPKTFDIEIYKYKIMSQNGRKDCCYECRGKQQNLNFFMPISEKNLSRIPFEKVKKLFEDANYILLTDHYENKKQYLEFVCEKHIDKGIQLSRLRNIKLEAGCTYCWIDRNSGSNNYAWKGGTTSLQRLLRESIRDWKNDSMKNSEYKCVLSGEKSKDLIIHHLYPFAKIVDETFEELGLDINESLGFYSDEELICIKEKINEIHYRYPLGVALNPKIHNDFHSVYGKENFTVDDFKKFAQDYYDKKIDFSYGKYKSKKYFPYKKKGTSKYRGVTKNLNRFLSSIKYNRKTLYIGCFESEYDAAKAYNDKAVELFGAGTTINKLDPADLKKKEELKYFKPAVGETSRFNGVSLHKNEGNRKDNYASRITVNGERQLVGFYPTEVEAAYFYNQRAIELFGDDAKLNKLTDDEVKFAEHRMKYFDHRVNEETIYTCVKSSGSAWQAEFTHDTARHYVGTFETDLAAALAYNYYVEKHQLDRKLNYITDTTLTTEDIIPLMEKDLRYFDHKTIGATIYSCVRKENQKWSTRAKINGKENRIGLFNTDKEAAIAYNEYVTKHKLNKRLNKIIN